MTGKTAGVPSVQEQEELRALARIPSLPYLEEQVTQELNRRLPVTWAARS